MDVSADDQDNCTVFNSTAEESLDGVQQPECNNNEDTTNDDLTRNSTVTFKPSPLLNSNHKLNSNQPELPITEWSVQDVVNYFRPNWGSYSESFLKFGIDGEKLIRLTKEDILQITDNKLGPSLKLYAFVEELKKKFCF